jgi:hypothetical protein
MSSSNKPQWAFTRRVFLKAALGALIVNVGCRSNNRPSEPGSVEITTIVDPNVAVKSRQVTAHPVRFTDATTAAGISWKFYNGAFGRYYFVESTGGGVALFDYNNDGLLDIFATQGGPIPGATGKNLNFRNRNVLYRNNGDGTFTDVTQGSGLAGDTGYGQGVSVADYNNDGWQDLYITAYGGNHLFRNNGNGTFTDVTEQAGLKDTQSFGHPSEFPWPLSSAWGDYDKDGHLDLFVCHYARWTPRLDVPCYNSDRTRRLCVPEMYEPSHCKLYHNNGDGTFTDVSEKAGLNSLKSKAMSAIWFDYDGDGWMDLFVTNDSMPSFLLHNNRNGTFTDKALPAGVSLDTGAMGISIADYLHNGQPDLFVVNFQGQQKSVFQNLGNGLFDDTSLRSGIGSTNLNYLGFGIECFDYDLDGWPDVIFGNGNVFDKMDAASAGSSYAQSQQLFHNQHDGTFVEDLHSLGDLTFPRVTRGLAVGDYDNDGDLDVLMVSQTGPLQLFRNDGGNANHWITLRLEGVKSNRDAIGARVVVETSSGRQTQWVKGGSSYCSHSDLRLTFGLGEEISVKNLFVRWPSGHQQKLGALSANTFYWLREGAEAIPDPRIVKTELTGRGA